jgi:predicted CoA-substrate-specific enzyme activase
METYLGVDVGSLYFHMVLLDGEGEIVESAYVPHMGDILSVCKESLGRANLMETVTSAVTGAGGDKIGGFGIEVDTTVSLVEGTKFLYPQVRNIIYIGAGSFSLIRLNEKGEYIRHTANSACASGTGAFLDQQAFRLHFTPEELSLAASRAGRCPGVATRCAVFAKTDMIHLQQEGYTPDEIACGLCRSMGMATIEMMLKGRNLKGQTVMIGGVARNDKVREALEEKLGIPVEVPRNPELVCALGAALLARQDTNRLPLVFDRIKKLKEDGSDKNLRPPLALTLSKYPDFSYETSYIDDDENEVSVPEKLEKGRTYDVVMGIDIGSTSTKATLMDRDRRTVAIVYRYTSGDPIRATQLVFKAFLDLEEKEGVTFNVLYAGTTGSGRKMIRAVIGAEIEKDEITAHAKAATFIDPEVDTIIEIGGQDSKFTQLRDGVVFNSVMNYVCAAGTGSFIAEQAKALDISIWDYADFVMGVQAPQTSDRCTVFMARDIKELLSDGFRRPEVAAAVLHSVRANYLNKVVNGLQIGSKVYFQGATARNKALVAAFEQELGQEILVSPYCHVTGAIGICLLLLDQEPAERSFRGLAFAREKVETSSEICELCNNRCNLTIIHTPSGTTAWGLKCGRDYEETRRKKKDSYNWELFERRQKLLMGRGKVEVAEPAFRVGLPMALTTYGYLPLWRRFFGELGGELVLSGASDGETFQRGKAQMAAEFCAPVVLGAGHILPLLQKNVDFLFLPHMIREERKGNFEDCHFCCYVQGFPSVVKSLEVAQKAPPFVSPPVQLGYQSRHVARTLHRHLSAVTDLPLRRVRKAFIAALTEQRRFEEDCRRLGAERLAELAEKGEMGIVILGRPYNLNDKVLTLELPRKIAEKGITVIPLDCLPMKVEDLEPRWGTMYWNYGQKILRGAQFVRDNPLLFGVFFTNFACGPDSYIVTYFKEIMNEARKPYLVLQFDGHGADAGYLTRVEAAIESFRAWKPSPGLVRMPTISKEMSKDRIVLVPPMDPISVRVFTAAFERFGYRTAILEESDETLALGYKYTLGGECVPCPSTLGSTLAYMDRHDLSPGDVALFMPGASGPCRFGQYSFLDAILFAKKGWEDFVILSPTAENAYQGLPQKLRKLLWKAIVTGDILQKIVFRLRPYEVNEGEVDRLAEKWLVALMEAFASPNGDTEKVFGQMLAEFRTVAVAGESRPKVAVVGEIYVRNNLFLTQDVFRLIERNGAEVLKTSVGEWIEYTAYMARNLDRGGAHGIWQKFDAFINNVFLHSVSKKLYGMAGDLVRDRLEPEMADVIRLGQEYVPVEFEGESILTIGRALHYIQYEGVDAIINASPTFCMPGTITTAIFARIEEETGLPCICLFYDGSGDPNREVLPHLHFLSARRKKGSRPQRLAVT